MIQNFDGAWEATLNLIADELVYQWKREREAA